MAKPSALTGTKYELPATKEQQMSSENISINPNMSFAFSETPGSWNACIVYSFPLKCLVIILLRKLNEWWKKSEKHTLYFFQILTSYNEESKVLAIISRRSLVIEIFPWNKFLRIDPAIFVDAQGCVLRLEVMLSCGDPVLIDVMTSQIVFMVAYSGPVVMQDLKQECN